MQLSGSTRYAVLQAEYLKRALEEARVTLLTRDRLHHKGEELRKQLAG